MSHPPVILWFRNDLRLADHAALTAAVATGAPVLPVYVLDDAAAGDWPMGGAARWWLHHSLFALAASLEARGARLLLRRGETARVLAELVAQTGATAIHTGIPVEPWARDLNAQVAKALPETELHAHRTATLFDLDDIETKTGTIYGVYTPFSRACRERGVPAPTGLPPRFAVPPEPRSEALDDWRLLPTHPDWAGDIRAAWQPGEAGARAKLEAFLPRVAEYDAARNLPGSDGTSMLSPHLHWGEVSAAQVWQRVTDHAPAGKGLTTFTNEVLWREFSAYLLWHHPRLPSRPLRAEFAAMPWRDDAAGLRAWQRGQTGVPIVDAGMRQLWQIGWMHNRVRMIVASFLIKHLLIRWQDGEAWFWDTLLEADLAANSASWQWVAGCGADAAPFFRVFNPVLQGFKFDAAGDYVRRWVPELARVDAAHIHAPWDAPPLALRQAGVVLGETYPHPIVDLAEGRDRALAAFKQVSAGRQSAA
jgi:deoxyribodipyrimidine photo-lyase